MVSQSVNFQVGFHPDEGAVTDQVEIKSSRKRMEMMVLSRVQIGDLL